MRPFASTTKKTANPHTASQTKCGIANRIRKNTEARVRWRSSVTTSLTGWLMRES
jgi:hypothetical protein